MKNLFGALAAMILFCQLSFSQTTQLIRGPYLQMGTPESMIVRWRTDVAAVGRITYGTTANNLTESLGGTTATTEHEFNLTGLLPNTKYFYSIATGSSTLTSPADTTFYFVTSPGANYDKPIHIWAIGDFGRNNPPQWDVKNTYLNTQKNGKHTDVWLWLGDNAYGDGKDSEFQTNVFEVYPEILRNTVAWPCPGNHDYKSVSFVTNDGPYYRILSLPKNGEAGGVPSNEEGYYSFDYGNIHFISLNSEWVPWILSDNTAMTNWLKADLAANTKKWVIAYWHQPPYSKGSHDSDNTSNMVMMRNNINPILEQHGVDLVLSGHSHNYERSFLIKGHTGVAATFDANVHLVDASCGNPANGERYIKYIDGDNVNEGTIYSVVGNSGTNTSGEPLNHPVFCNAFQDEYGSMAIDVTNTELHAKYFDKDGLVKDEFIIEKRSVNSVASQPLFTKYFMVYPNPVVDEMNIEFHLPKEQSITVAIYDMNGAVVKNIVDQKSLSGKQEFTWRPEALVKGNYIVKLSNGKTELEKIISLK